MAKLINPLINGANGVTDYLNTDGEEAPTTKWFNPMWDQWLQRAQDASGGSNPMFGRRGGGMKLPDSQDIDHLGMGARPDENPQWWTGSQMPSNMTSEAHNEGMMPTALRGLYRAQYQKQHDKQHASSQPATAEAF